MVRSVRKEGVEANSWKYRFAIPPIATLIRKDRYIATPPKRGRGVRWTWWSWPGETQPRAMAKARTLLVRTHEDNNDNPKIPKYKNVN